MRTIPSILPNLFAAFLLVCSFAGCSSGKKVAGFEESARKYFDAGEYEKAKIEYMNVVKLDAANVNALYRLGMIWLEQGAPMRALPYLNEAVRLSSANVPARTKLMEAWLTLGESGEALKEAEAILKAAPTSGDALILLVQSARTPEEVASARDRIAAFPAQNAADVHLANASLCLRESDKAGAGIALTKVLAADPKSARALVMSADLLLRESDVAGAAAKLKAAANASPARSRYRIMYAGYMVNQSSPESKKEARELIANLLGEAPDYIPALILSAQVAFDDNKADDSLATLKKVFAIDFENVGARLLESKVFLARGEVEKAIEDLEGILKRFPAHFVAKFQLAKALLSSANREKALTILKEVVRENPAFAEATLLLAEVNLRSGDSVSAIPPVEAILKQLPSNPEVGGRDPFETLRTLTFASYLLAEAYQAQGRLDDAAKLMQNLISMAPEDPRPQFRLGEILRSAGRMEDARKAFGEALKMTPGSLAVVVQLIELDLSEKKPEAAMARINGYIQEKPEAAGAYLVKGRIRMAAQAWNDAEASILKAMELDPASLEAPQLLASTYVASGRLQDAADRLEAVLAKHPKDTGTLLQAALIFQKQKEFTKARDAYERILADQPDAAAVINNLAALYSGPLNDLTKAYELAVKARKLRPRAHPAAPQDEKAAAAAIADTLGWIQFLRGQYSEALICIAEAAQESREHAEVNYHLGMAAGSMGRTEVALTALTIASGSGDDFPERSEATARLALLKAAGTMGISEIQALLKDHPKDVFLQMVLAEAREREKDLPGAANEYEKVLSLNPDHLPAALKLGMLYAVHLQKKDKALEIARKANPLARDDGAAAGTLGIILYEAGACKEAYELLRTGTNSTKDDPVLLRYLALASYSQNEFSAARSNMEKVRDLLKSTPDSPQVAAVETFLRFTADAAGDPKTLTALAPAAESILKEDNGYVPALMVRAGLQFLNKDPGAAIATYTAVLDKFPGFAPAAKQLAALYAANPETMDKAYDLAMGARQFLPDDVDLARTLAALCHGRKSWRLAVQLFEQVAAKHPLDANSLFLLGVSYQQTGEKEKSVTALKSAMSAGLPEALASEAARIVEDLNKK